MCQRGQKMLNRNSIIQLIDLLKEAHPAAIVVTKSFALETLIKRLEVRQQLTLNDIEDVTKSIKRIHKHVSTRLQDEIETLSAEKQSLLMKSKAFVAKRNHNINLLKEIDKLEAKDPVLEEKMQHLSLLSQKLHSTVVPEKKSEEPSPLTISEEIEQNEQVAQKCSALLENVEYLSSAILILEEHLEKHSSSRLRRKKVSIQNTLSDFKSSDAKQADEKKQELQGSTSSDVSAFDAVCQRYLREWDNNNSSVLTGVNDPDDEKENASMPPPVDSGPPHFIKSEAHQLVTTLIRERNNIPVHELTMATELLHRTDAMVKAPADTKARLAYGDTLLKLNGQTNLIKIVGGIALGIFGAGLLAGSIAFAAFTLGTGSLVSIFTAKMSIALMTKAFILVGSTVGSGIGTYGMALGAAIALEGRQKPVVRAAHRFWKETERKEPKKEAKMESKRESKQEAKRSASSVCEPLLKYHRR
jgi:hypothetical protein